MPVAKKSLISSRPQEKKPVSAVTKETTAIGGSKTLKASALRGAVRKEAFAFRSLKKKK